MENYQVPVEVFFQLVYGFIAVCGGAARYLRGYADGVPFRFSIFVASMFFAGFSGWIFSLIGQSMMLPDPITFGMAGIGGFFGDQTLKLALEYFAAKVPKS